MQPHDYEDLGWGQVHGHDNLEDHLNVVHGVRRTNLMGMSQQAKEGVHASEHLTTEVPSDPFEGLLKMLTALGPVTEAVAGYKKKCMQAGFGEEAADMMAAHLHEALMKVVFNGSR